MSRIYKLKKIYKEPLTSKHIKDTSRFIQNILNADVTKGKYARFLIEAFLSNKFSEWDFFGGVDSTVGQAISLFHKHKHKLTIEQRSIYALNKETKLPLYQSPGDLWKAVKQFQEEKSGKELRKQKKIYRETEFIYTDKNTGFQIVSPLTEESARWWSEGTCWNTLSDKYIDFKLYFSTFPLLILLMPDKQKLKLWINNNIIIFKNQYDKTVPLDYIEQNWNILEPVCRWLNSLRYIPEKLKTKEICELAVKKNLWALEYVPEHLITDELFRLAVTQNWKALTCIPEHLRTKKMCELAIQQSGWALSEVPRQHKTIEMCLEAVKQNGLALYYVNYKDQTIEMCLEAVKQNGDALKYVPEYLKTPELCELAIKQDGRALSEVPVRLRTKKICELAVQQNEWVWSLSYVPEYLKTPKLCEIAVKSNGKALGLVPYVLRTKKMCKIAVQQNGKALEYVPKELRTKKMCKIALNKDGIMLYCVPDKIRTSELCELAVTNNKEALLYVPNEYITKEMCLEAVKEKFLNSKYVSKKPEKPKNHKPFELPIEKYHEIFREIKQYYFQ